MNLKETDACPSCWHKHDHSVGGIGTFPIHNIIGHKGGVLNEFKTCSVCNWNWVQVQHCKKCKKNQPCSTHYACGYNGTLNNNMPIEIHNLYMRNSPYQRVWSERPASIGRWYGKQPTSYVEALDFVRRFTMKFEVHRDLVYLENGLKYSTNVYNDFWNGFMSICQRYFSSTDDTSNVMRSYFQTLRGSCANPKVFPLYN